MPESTQIENKTDVTILPCITPDCNYHVKFDPSKQPIPAFAQDFKKLQGEVTIYLDCDNPTSHRNKYKIKI